MDYTPTPEAVRFKATRPRNGFDYAIQSMYAVMRLHLHPDGHLDDIYMQPILEWLKNLNVPREEYLAWIRATKTAVKEDRAGISQDSSYIPDTSPIVEPNIHSPTPQPPTRYPDNQTTVSKEKANPPSKAHKGAIPTSKLFTFFVGAAVLFFIFIGLLPKNNNENIRAVPTATKITIAAAPTLKPAPNNTPYIPPTERPIPTSPPARQQIAPVIPATDTPSGCPNGCEYPPRGCDIKGNISVDSGAKIYHLPYQRYYAATIISPAYGERWFCTEQEAIDNGWRRSKE